LRDSNIHATESGFRWRVAALENSDVDEVMRHLQDSIEKAEIERFRALSVWMGVAGPGGSKAGCDSVNSVRES
jgi:hypothetical protein